MRKRQPETYFWDLKLSERVNVAAARNPSGPGEVEPSVNDEIRIASGAWVVGHSLPAN